MTVKGNFAAFLGYLCAGEGYYIVVLNSSQEQQWHKSPQLCNHPVRHTRPIKILINCTVGRLAYDPVEGFSGKEEHPTWSYRQAFPE